MWAALLAWLQVRAAGGKFLLRIEDLDRERCRPEYVDALLRDLEYLRLYWDEEPIFQSRRTEAYRAALEQLTRQGRLYPCFCSRTEIARAASAPQEGAERELRYPGTCAALSQDSVKERAQRRPPAQRFRPFPGVTVLDDQLLGRFAQDVEAEVGDFVVARNDGVASYQLAVVVDDAESDITDVLRGEDLLSSTPRQLQLYRALSLQAPRFTHVPLLLGADGKRLAKREGAFAISELRAAGVAAERVIGLLARWAGLHDGTAVTASALISHFSLQHLSREPIRTTEEQVRQFLGF
jgi:glutamyl-tRNA synthetase